VAIVISWRMEWMLNASCWELVAGNWQPIMMRLDITGRHVEITPPLRQLIDRRLAKLGRLLNDSAISGTIVLTREKYRHLAEIVIHARGDHILRGIGQGTTWPLSLRQASQKIEQQAQTMKGKWARRKRQADARTVKTAPAEPPAARRVVRTSRVAVKPMSVEDAALRVETGPDTFVVFRNAETDAVSILYRRKDGNLGLIEPD
jgi:putative sigma-54 modulation protein